MLNTLVIRGAAFCVLASGGVLYAMDSGLIGSAEGASADVAGEQTLTSESRAVHSLSPELPIIATHADVRLPMAAEPVAPEAMVVPATFDNEPETPAPETPTELSDLGLPCDITLTATAMPAAMVALDVMAPCRTEAAVQINHSGMMFEAQTDALGLLTLDIPAFETPAFFSVTFDDGVEETVLVGLPDLLDFDRIGLTWQGDMGLELHAMEFGAEFGGEGHVWQEAPATADAAIAGEGGFLTEVVVGDSFTQVYTLPRATLREGESVRLSIDAPITANNCAASVLARTLRTEGAGPVDITELTFTVPGCDAIGDVLVLQNLLDDLRLASN
ncbi:hypothetical protein [Gymnodinialimonas hymeniacidonis]|uniref:hypothetical protein n=1 Tax=Gymnodinialimonas hymeniacidonis TaxID=3126508 RepID=UPI0034C620CC